MKKQRRKPGVLLAAVMLLLVLAGCAQKEHNIVPKIEQGHSDLEYVQAKGMLVVGITDFAPMDYRDGQNWTGFDADLAETFAESLGVTLRLMEIDWDRKTELLENGSIDCIWNGMTMTDKLQEEISCSEPYLSNAQVIVLRSSDIERYATEEVCRHLLFAVEAGSTGEAFLKDKNYRFTTYANQKKALQSVQSKQADAAVIDNTMAAYYTSEGAEFSNLGYSIILNDETICVGFRKGSDLTEKANALLEAAYDDGTIQALAEQYGIENALLR